MKTSDLIKQKENSMNMKINEDEIDFLVEIFEKEIKWHEEDLAMNNDNKEFKLAFLRGLEHAKLLIAKIKNF